MFDPYHRRIDYLRVSITDRCNFRCVYCMPEQGFPAVPKEQSLTFEEIARLVRIAVSLGITKVRLTGGEPLLRKELPHLIQEIASFPGIEDISCTTNGYLLEEQACRLALSGLHRINVSLDTLRPDRFTEIARRGSLDRVLAGIDAAFDAGLNPVKLNCVLMKGVNDDEVADFAAMTLERDIHVRFIELMPMRWNLDESPAYTPGCMSGLVQLKEAAGGMLSDAQMRRMFLSADEARHRIERAMGAMEEADVRTNGPARSFRIPGAKGTVGFISQITHDFCERCNRIRLTSDGFLRPCLMSDGELDLRTPLRSGASEEDLAELFLHVVEHKPERHYLAEGQKVVGRGMSQIGG
ncbi:MAG TPA: GTP 3',8-cyclase MoaA [Fimbriimonadaceae bacterium]|nr:GTP 3',8-cyclase MoaA [Fimbriimonadaceae bacterium]